MARRLRMGPSLQRRQTWMAELWPWQPRMAPPRQAFSASLPLGSNQQLTVNCHGNPLVSFSMMGLQGLLKELRQARLLRCLLRSHPREPLAR